MVNAVSWAFYGIAKEYTGPSEVRGQIDIAGEVTPQCDVMDGDDVQRCVTD